MRMIRNMALLSILLAGASAVSSTAEPPQNLVRNPGFEAGNTGFTSDYHYTANPYAPGEYTIGPNPFPDNNLWPNMQPHNGREMMIVNGAEYPSGIVWSENALPVKPHKIYYFTGYVASLFGANPPALIISINGEQTGPILTLGEATAQWTRFSIPWDSGTSGMATISISDQNMQANGNDFALDDLAFAATLRPFPPQPVQSWQPPWQTPQQAQPPVRPPFDSVELWNRPQVTDRIYPDTGYGCLGTGFAVLGIGLAVLGLSLVALGLILLCVVVIHRRN